MAALGHLLLRLGLPSWKGGTSAVAPSEPSLDFSNPDNSQYIVVLIL